MKETDYTVIQNEVREQLLEQDWTIEEYLDEDSIVLAITNIYTTNDLVSGFAQDFKTTVYCELGSGIKRLSIITNQDRVSIILDSNMSYYKPGEPLCGYESIEEDIYAIFIAIQAVFDRMNL